MTEPAQHDVDRRAADEVGTLPPATVQVTSYLVSCLPEGEGQQHLSVKVEYRGGGRWAIVQHGQCLGVDGSWSWESIPSEREDEWIDAHRFDLDTALVLAKQAAPLLTVNGFTITDVIAMNARRAAR